MSVHLADFPRFFGAVNHGLQPFSWQMRLVEHILREGRWPDQIDAPTGSGKSAVIEIHAFVNAVAACRSGLGKGTARPPRRLAITVDRRALVDDHSERADRLALLLANPRADPLVQSVANALRQMRAEGEEHTDMPLVTAKLRGGAKPDREWLDAPTACQVIAGTPDMIGSRLLFRGYGSTRFAWPREAGLLAFDTVMVVDEAHLNRQLVTTGRRIGQLVTEESSGIGVPPLGVCAMTATQADGIGQEIGVEAEDLEAGGSDATLADRLTRPKPVTIVPTSAWSPKRHDVDMMARQIADLVRQAHAEHGSTVGCVVNRVELALAVSRRLQTPAGRSRSESATGLGRSLEVVTLVGPMRPVELHNLRNEHSPLFTLAGDASVDVLVATQTVEVGMDLNLSCLVTQLASGSAIAQRAGRVNRSGDRPAGPVYVIVPDETAADMSTTRPYAGAEICEAYEWLKEIAESPLGLAPWSIHPRGGGMSPPAASLPRGVLHRPERWDVKEWARTGDWPVTEPWLDLWLSDSLDPDLAVGLLVRAGLPEDDTSARQQIAATPPLNHEVFPVSLPVWRTIASSPEESISRRRAFVVRPSGIEALSGREAVATFAFRPGDLVVLDSVKSISRQEGVITTESADGNEREDVGELPGGPDGRPKRRWVRLAASAPALRAKDGLIAGAVDLLSDVYRLVTASGGEDVGGGVQELVSGWLSSVPEADRGNDRLNLLAALLKSEDLEVVPAEYPAYDTRPSGIPDDFWVVLAGSEALADDESLQVWHPAKKANADKALNGEGSQPNTPREIRHPVQLAQHQQAVERLARLLTRELGLSDQLVTALSFAGLVHDEGKRDPRFQRLLRWREGDHPGLWLAKSGMTSQRAIGQAKAASGLPRGWRHEQLSAAIAWELAEDALLDQTDLVLRLIGTSHGRGRHEFPHTGRNLSDAELGLRGREALFERGGWDALLERTHRQWGTWGCAYLEALLRAADANVSRSGS
ncbi:MAG: type I-U CRISPR-associated helicase/endonuclease Cas3 [Bifidobacteriaceae bacterium]|jgi:CRISPR-associated endonuclease/helicase Cas3|nr:type I-U CRISPR-associated helicase/endonuclease Cas3 [Bifidobacteriaceae bacterium]